MKHPKSEHYPNSIFIEHIPDGQWEDRPHKVLRWFANDDAWRDPVTGAFAVNNAYLHEPHTSGNFKSRAGAKQSFKYPVTRCTGTCLVLMLVFAEGQWHKVCEWWADDNVRTSNKVDYQSQVPAQFQSAFE